MRGAGIYPAPTPVAFSSHRWSRKWELRHITEAQGKSVGRFTQTIGQPTSHQNQQLMIPCRKAVYGPGFYQRITSQGPASIWSTKTGGISFEPDSRTSSGLAIYRRQFCFSSTWSFTACALSKGQHLCERNPEAFSASSSSMVGLCAPVSHREIVVAVVPTARPSFACRSSEKLPHS